MKEFLVILYSKSIDGTLLIRLKASSAKGIIDKAIEQLYLKQYNDHLSKGYKCTFNNYVERCLQSDGLHHVATIQEPKRIVNADYFSI